VISSRGIDIIYRKAPSNNPGAFFFIPCVALLELISEVVEIDDVGIEKGESFQ